MTDLTAHPFNADSALFGHTSIDTAYLVGDYPYGYTQRTEIRYWIETVAKKGDRLVSQTFNPKTGRWNKPKASTYSPVMAMYLNDKGHVTHASVSTWAEDEWIARFRAVAEGQLSADQSSQLARVIGLKRVFEKVTFTVTEGAPTAEEKAEQAATERRIARAVAHETALAAGEVTS